MYIIAVRGVLASVFFFAAAPAVMAAPTFNPDPGVRLTSAVPQAVTGAFPTMRLYYLISSTAVLSASTADGVTFAAEAGTRLSTTTIPQVDASTITGLSILPLAAGGFRMLYSAIGSVGAYRIFSATSADGLAWANETVRIGGTATYLGSPRLVKLTDGTWKIFYVANSVVGANNPPDYRVYSSASSDEGVTWSAATLTIDAAALEVAASTNPLTSGKVRLYYTLPSVSTAAYSVISADATAATFTSESGVRLSTGGGGVFSPLVVASTDSFRYRFYYNLSSTAPLMSSAVTDAPAPASISPNVVYKGIDPGLFTISGDIFSDAATVLLRKTGSADVPGTSVTRVTDQTITANFAIVGNDPGVWDLVVTNGNAQTGTLSNAILIDFSPGKVVLTDNLMRPRNGTRTRIDITIFTAGRVTLRILTMEGRQVSTLMDRDLPEGQTTAFWDGKSSLGSTVSSGVYLLEVKGPKIKMLKKIVVIK